MRRMRERVLALLLALIMVVGVIPVPAFAAEEPIYVLAGGDFQAGDNGKEDHYYSRINMGNILDKIKETYSTMDGFIFVGDYDGDTHNDSNAATGIVAMMDEVDNRYPTLNYDNSILMQGNHESNAVPNIDPTGGYDFDGYAVYSMNQSDYCERQEGKSSHIQTVANNLKTWLNNKIGEGYDAPIFVTAHVPLAYGTRTYTNGDGLYAKYIFDVLNDAADAGLNIIFLHGHDHAYGADNYLGGEAIYLAKGDKINIAEPGNKSAWTEETLNFTYMNAGYVGYYNENYYNVKSYEAEKLTMTVFKIENDKVTVERYSKDGLYNLKSAGREGFYANGGTCAGLGLSYNTTVYASPQTITLAEVEDYGDIGNWVGVTGSAGADDVTPGKNGTNGWVEIIAPVKGTPATEASTTYKYVLDKDGVNAGGRYLILNVKSSDTNNSWALTNNNGRVDSTYVTINNEEIIVEDNTNINIENIEWTFSGSTRGTIGNQDKYIYLDRYENFSFTDSGVNTTFESRGEGEYRIYRLANSRYNYLRCNNGAWTKGSTSNASNISSVYLFAYDSTITTEDKPATPDTNGTFAAVVGNLTYTATSGMSAQQALDNLKAQLTGYVYEGMSAPTSATAGTDITEQLEFVLDSSYGDGTTAGDYAVKVSYNGKELGTAEVVVPATTTYYAAEGNGLYLVDMNTSADNAMAAVKAGVTVYSATDANGTGKKEVSDGEVTWTWKDKYNGADSGPYTVEILKDGHSLGTVEVKVDIQYETGIKTDWTYIGETAGSGGQYTYTLDTNGIDAGSGNKYIIVAESQALALHTVGTSAATAVSVNISSDGKTLTTNTRDYEYYWNTTYGFTRGSFGLNQNSYYIYLGEKSASYLDGVINNGDGTYCLYDNDGTKRTLYYGTRDGNTRFLVSEESNYKDVSVRLYKYTGTTGGTAGGKIYALIEGNTVYTVEQGTSAAAALAKVKAGITGYTATAEDGTGKTEIDDAKLTFKWKNTYASMVTGSYWVEISYQGKVLGTVEVKVEPGVINNYPEYPNEGSVKVNKTGTGIDFQSSGIAQVEISASGVPIKKGADVIVMVDTSSSMNTCITHGTRDCKDSACQGKYRSHAFEASLKNLIAQFKTPGDDGQLLDMRVAIADFNGFDKDTDKYPWSWNPKDILVDDVQYDATNYGTVYTGANAGTRDLTASAFVNVADLKDSYSFTYHSGTNYDYAFDVVYQLATAIQAANAEERDLYVIFMSDGAPMQYNYFHSNGRSDLLQYYLQGQITESSSLRYRYDGQESNSYRTATGYGAFKSGANTAYYNAEGKHWMAEAIKGDPNTDYKVIRKGIEGADANGFITIKGLGAKMFSIAFCPAVDQHTPVVAMTHVLETIASEQTGTTQYYYNVNTAEQLTDAFDAIGSEIAYAAYNARYVDQMGDDYDLQLKTKTYTTVVNGVEVERTVAPVIEIGTYTIYTRQDYLDGKCTEAQVGNRTGSFKLTEVVKFSDDGTKAYSNLVDVDGDGIFGVTVNADGTYTISDTGDNIFGTNGVIDAKNFWYNTNATAVAVAGVSIPTGTKADGTTTGSTNQLPSETFYWKLGTVQTSELAMRYYVYLEGSMEGTREGGSYPTNEYATLYYDNYLHNPCKKDTVSPVMPWKEANVSYAFYLVNESGEIIVNQSTGLTGSFANKIAVTNPVVYDTVLLNTSEQLDAVQAARVLPDGYTLYDGTYDNGNLVNGATYTVTVNSNTTGGWAITSVKDVATTYVVNYDPNNATAYSKDKSESQIGHDYTHTTVWFAVVWKVQALPDSVVIDYGLPVDISVLTNDMFGEKGKLAGVGAYSDSLKLDGHDTTLTSGFGNSYTGTYGIAKADTSTGKVRYTLNTMQMNGYEKFAYAVNYTGNENAGYYYDTVTVIPATTIYYEDNFLTYSVWDNNGTASDASDDQKTADVWGTEGDRVNDATQDEDRPGAYSLTDANNIYGYDSVNKSMATYSLGQARKVHVGGNTYAQAEFTFWGTGFDVISMTSNKTGLITVQVYPHGAEKTAENQQMSTAVDTYYGYTAQYYNVTYTYKKGAWVETIGTKLTAEPAEAPIALPKEGTEGQIITTWKTVNSLTNENEALYQVPVIQIENLTYGQYDVVLKASYSSFFDHNSDVEGYDLYLDAVRIYDPANDGASDGTEDNTIENAYKADGEGWPTYLELRDQIIAANTFSVTVGETEVEGLMYIDGDSSIGDAYISDYTNYGPNNEVYLDKGQRVAFIISASDDNIAGVHIGVKSADGKAATYTITNIARNANDDEKIEAGDYYGEKTYTVDTATDMYYDLTGWKNDIIVISNTGNLYNTEGIISLTNIKFTYKEDPNGINSAGIMPLSLDADEPAATPATTGYVYMTPAAATLTLRALNAPTVPETPVEPEQPEEPETPVEPEQPEEPETPEQPEKPEQPEEPEEPEIPEVPQQPSYEETVKTVAKKIVKTIKSLFGWLFK